MVAIKKSWNMKQRIERSAVKRCLQMKKNIFLPEYLIQRQTNIYEFRWTHLHEVEEEELPFRSEDNKSLVWSFQFVETMASGDADRFS